ncbi:MAG TPA: CHASE3 domain-containing protein [Rhizomicrobium sp.]|nr:CHASE3 domain-containing protein [Rhizomicrobium sp.]
MLPANRLTLLFGIPVFLLLVAVAVIGARVATAERDMQAWIVHTYEVMNEARAALSSVQDAETGQRGFLLTGDKSYLEPYRNGREAFERHVENFRNLTTDNPAEQARAGKLKVLGEDRLDLLEKRLALGPANSSPDAVGLMARGGERMDGIRDVVSDALADEQHLLDRRRSERHKYENQMIATAAAGAALALAILISALVLLIRSNRQLSKSQAQETHQAEMLQATLDSMRDGVAVFDSEGHLCAYNEQFISLLGFPKSLTQPGTTLSMFEDAARKAGNRVFEQLSAIPDMQPSHYEQLHLGDRVLDIYRTPVPSGGVLFAAEDVTARLRSEATLRQSQKMEAIGHLTGGVAHDFNNLLQIVSANLDLIAADVRGLPRASERLQNAVAAIHRGSRLTGQLLAFARRQTLEPRSTNVGRLLQDITDLVRRTLGERINVESIVAGGLWNTMIDPNRIENAILNLAINARDAMPDGGSLTIEVANAFLDDAYAALHDEVVPGQYVMLAVSDTGTGMPPEIAARVFEPFFTTKPEGQGTGLGLSQVYGFVKQSGGHIKIYSEVGQGTTVKLYLPRTRAPEEGTGPIATTPIEGGTETILVVEDDEGVRAAVIDMLGELGYSVLKAANAEQALTILESGATIDLLFTDVVMPGPIKTRDLARRAQELHPSLQVLFTSGYTQNAIVHNGRLDDGVHLLSKPYRRDELARKLRSLLGASRKPGVPIVETAPPVSAPPARETAPQAAKPNGGPRKVLVVEDVALIRMTTLDMLEELGIAGIEAGDGPSALALIESDPEIDLVLTDLGLPGMSGQQLVAEVRKLRPRLKIVVATGYSNESRPSFDGVSVLIKPFDLGQLRDVLLG